MSVAVAEFGAEKATRVRFTGKIEFCLPSHH